MEAERAQALEERVEVELALGGGGELVGELTDLVAQHPYREGLHGALMRALYRAGRQADALEVFRRAGRLLREDLGTEPGDDLQRLHRAILNRDPALHAVAPEAAGAAVRELPATASCFVGRDQETAWVRERLLPPPSAAGASGRPAVVVLYGLGGVGKSALAVRVAHELAGGFPDGQLYADLCGSTPGVRPLSAVEVLGRFLRRLGVAPDQIPPGEAEAAALFRSVTAGRRLLFVLDNATGKGQAASLLPAAPTCAVLLTSRQPLSSLDADARMRLGVLDDADALALLCELTRERAVEPEAARSVVELSGGLPLAIRVAAGRLATRPDLAATTYVQRLADRSRRLDELELGDLAVRACIRTSYDMLRTDGTDADRLAARAFRMLGLLHVPTVTPWVVAAMLGEPEPEVARAALDRLVDAQLIEPVADGHYQLHDLVRLLATERAEAEDPPPERQEAVTRAITYYTVALWRAEGTLRAGRVAPFGEPSIPDDVSLPRFDNPVRARTWIDNELTNLVAGLEQAAAAGDASGRSPLWMAHALWNILNSRCEWQAACRVSQAMITSTEGRGDEEMVAWAHLLHGRSEACFGRYDTALHHLDRALVLSRELGHHGVVALALMGLGIVHARRDEPLASLSAYHEVLESARRLNIREVEATALNNMSVSYALIGDFQQAAAVARRSTTIYAALGDLVERSSAVSNFSVAQCLCGNHAEALKHADEVSLLSRELGDCLQESDTMLVRAEINLRWGRLADAHSDVEQVLLIARTSGHRYAWAAAQWVRHKVLNEMGNVVEAAEARRIAEAAYAELTGVFRDPLIELLVRGPTRPGWTSEERQSVPTLALPTA